MPTLTDWRRDSNHVVAPDGKQLLALNSMNRSFACHFSPGLGSTLLHFVRQQPTQAQNAFADVP